MPPSPYSAADDQRLLNRLLSPEIALYPERFVRFAYPWGQPNTPLQHFSGPRAWQEEELKAVGEHLRSNLQAIKAGGRAKPFKAATVSGRGPGKSAINGWLNHWMQSTCLGSTCLVSANSEPQLKNTTFPEIKKWFTLAINAHWFDAQALSISPAAWFADQVRRQLKIDTSYYHVQAKLWTEEAPDAYAGPHSHHGMMLTFDEASGIPKPIFVAAEGFFTEPTAYRFWLARSNGRRNSGEFFELFDKPTGEWRLKSIDIRTVEGIDPGFAESIIKRYGADSDEARIEVYGKFPLRGDNQFIGAGTVHEARTRELLKDPGEALVMGVDVARQGRDATVIRWRQGRDARSIPPVKLHGLDNMQVAERVAGEIMRTRPDAVFIDAGNGTGVIDRLRQLRFRVHEVWFGSSSPEKEWKDKRTFMYARLRDWLAGGCIDDDAALVRDLTSPGFHYVDRSETIIRLESKDDMRKRGLPSPDDGDALALTFAAFVARRDRTRLRPAGDPVVIATNTEYPLFR